MPRHTLKLLILLTAFSVAPAAAGHQLSLVPPAGLHSKCPFERARAEAAWTEAVRAAAATRKAPTPTPTTITLTDRAPGLFTFGGATSSLTP